MPFSCLPLCLGCPAYVYMFIVDCVHTPVLPPAHTHTTQVPPYHHAHLPPPHLPTCYYHTPHTTTPFLSPPPHLACLPARYTITTCHLFCLPFSGLFLDGVTITLHTWFHLPACHHLHTLPAWDFLFSCTLPAIYTHYKHIPHSVHHLPTLLPRAFFFRSHTHARTVYLYVLWCPHLYVHNLHTHTILLPPAVTFFWVPTCYTCTPACLCTILHCTHVSSGACH